MSAAGNRAFMHRIAHAWMPDCMEDLWAAVYVSPGPVFSPAVWGSKDRTGPDYFYMRRF